MTKLSRRQELLAVLALLFVGLWWGGAFVTMKAVIDQQPVADFLAVRFTIASVFMAVVYPKAFKGLTRRDVVRGVTLGGILGSAYVTQTIGLLLATAAITGFLTGIYVVATPLIAWLLLRERVSGRVLIGTVLATAGLALISINFEAGLEFDVNHLWVILSAFLFGAHIVGLSHWSRGINAYALTVLQLGAVAVFCWVLALIDGFQAPPTAEVWYVLVFTALFASALAFLVQTWAQARMDASRVAIVLTSEVVFTAIIAVAVGQETLLPRVIIGGAVLVSAMLVIEWPSKK